MTRPFLYIVILVGLWTSVAQRTAAQSPRHLVPFAGGVVIKTLEQNWDDSEAEWFYNVAQGSKLIRYKWFLHLEQPVSDKLFREDTHIRSLGYLPRTPGGGNSDGLPVGFVRDGLDLGLNCAACHTTLLKYNNKAWLVDGAPTLADFEVFMRRLEAALSATLHDDAKFNRFADRVLGADASAEERSVLREAVAIQRDLRRNYNLRNMSRSHELRFGPGRIDAIGAIMNEVTSRFAQLPDNHAPADAPVSYPFLWDTPHHDRVEWNGAVPNIQLRAGIRLFGTKHVGALGRNAGEVMGVFGNVQVKSDSLLIPAFYPSTVNLPHLAAIEESLRKLWSPQWPSEFPNIDQKMAGQGAKLFKNHCAECHEQEKFDRTDKDRKIEAWLKGSVGTDPAMWANFLFRRAKTGLYEGQLINHGVEPGIDSRFGPEEDVNKLLKHAVIRVLLGGGSDDRSPRESLDSPTESRFGSAIEVDLGNGKLTARFESITLEKGLFRSGRIADSSELFVRRGTKVFKANVKKGVGEKLKFPLDDLESVSVQPLPRKSKTFSNEFLLQVNEGKSIAPVYKARPLNGIWATAPYLHNGSVPNLDELLMKPGDRSKKFKVGSQEFDPVKVGFRSDVGDFEFDTTRPGNLNIGHDYGSSLSIEERRQLVEYMKTL